jgi:hypothetical protein
MAGYKGYSMSNNAVSAYSSGRKPLSKWTKDDLVSFYRPYASEVFLKRLDAMSLKEAKSSLLVSSGEWHHTSSHYNKTLFYAPRELNESEWASPKELYRRDFKKGYSYAKEHGLSYFSHHSAYRSSYLGSVSESVEFLDKNGSYHSEPVYKKNGFLHGILRFLHLGGRK